MFFLMENVGMSSNTLTPAMETLNRIQKRAKKLAGGKLDNGKEQPFPVAANYGEGVRQGDIYIRLEKSLPAGATKIEKPELQLVPGSTKGSRHTLDSLQGITLYQKPGANVLEGPYIEATQPFKIVHPQHGDWAMPAGLYRVTYQRTEAEELARRLD